MDLGLLIRRGSRSQSRGTRSQSRGADLQVQKADLEVEEADRPQLKEDGDREEEEADLATESQQQPEQQHGEEPPRRGTEEKYAEGCRRRHPHELTADLSGRRWKVRGRKKDRQGAGRTYMREVSPGDFHSRAEERAGAHFPFSREPPAAAPKSLQRAARGRARRNEPETPGCGVVFGQGRKHERLQPTSARPSWTTSQTPILYNSGTFSWF
jgi:hypothetical protein